MDKIKSSQLRRFKKEYNETDNSLQFKEWLLLESQKPHFSVRLFGDESLEDIYSTEQQMKAFYELLNEL